MDLVRKTIYENTTGWDSSDGKFAVFKKPDDLQNEARLLTSGSFMDKFGAKSVYISLAPSEKVEAAEVSVCMAFSSGGGRRLF